MKNGWKRRSVFVSLILVCMSLFTACGTDSKTETKAGNTEEVANDYYIDLTDLGMKLTFYLRLDEAGNFQFSNTLDFTVDKSSGTFQETDGEYVMIYSSVNGEEKSISEGLTSSFMVLEDGSLDFSNTECVYYGSARASSSAADNPETKLIAHVVSDNYEAPEQESSFKNGVYTAEAVEEQGVVYTHFVSFFEDGTYLHLISYEQEDRKGFVTETGKFGVSTTQIALEPDGGSRTESEVVDEAHLMVSILPYPGADARVLTAFEKTEERIELVKLSGNGKVKGSDEIFDVQAVIWSDGSYETYADGFVESGVLALDSTKNYVKQYPDHPERGVRGLNQVATVPSAVFRIENGKITLEGLRVRKSEGLSRHECTVTEE